MALLERSDSYGEMQRVVDYLFKNTPIVERLDVILAAPTCEKSWSCCRRARIRASLCASR